MTNTAINNVTTELDLARLETAQLRRRLVSAELTARRYEEAITKIHAICREHGVQRGNVVDEVFQLAMSMRLSAHAA